MHYIEDLLTFTLTFYIFAGLFAATLHWITIPLSWYYLGKWHSLPEIFWRIGILLCSTLNIHKHTC